MNTRDNQRSRLTELLLKNAYIELMQSKSTNKITIKELCEKAELNRTTFYLHYNEPNDILKNIEDEIIENTANYISEIGADINDGAIDYIIAFLDYIKENDKLFRLFLIENDNPYFKEKFTRFSLKKLLEALTCAVDEKYKEYILGYLINGCMSIIQTWIEMNYSIRNEEVAMLLFNLCDGALEGYTK